MQYFLWTLASFISYIGGLIILVRVTPMLLVRSYDEGAFMGVAALDILGALLAFGAVVITYNLFNGNLAIKILDFAFLLGIIGISGRLALASFRPRSMKNTLLVSRILAGGYTLFLILASLYLLVLLFTPA